MVSAAHDSSSASTDPARGDGPDPGSEAHTPPSDTKKPARKPARGAPGSFDQPEPRPDVMPQKGGPHPEQTAEVPLGSHGQGTPPGSRGHNRAPVVKEHSDGHGQ